MKNIEDLKITNTGNEAVGAKHVKLSDKELEQVSGGRNITITDGMTVTLGDSVIAVPIVRDCTPKDLF